MLDATPLVRLYAARRRAQIARMDVAAAQRRELARLTARAARTRFGRDHDFARIRTVDDFQTRVPLRRYEDFWRDYWRAPFPRLRDVSWPGRVPFFAVTSGTTTGVTKYIPCTHEMNRSNVRVSLDLVCHHLAARPASRLFGGRALILGGSTDLKTEAVGIRSGDLSGIAQATTPWWARPLTFPPRDIALLDDWEAKVAHIVARAPAARIRSVAGTPSWLLILFEALFAESAGAARRLASVFPELELLVHGGISFAPYKRRFDALLEGTHAETREAYAASEGFVAVADRGFDEGLRPSADAGLFFEFVPLDELGRPAPTRHWLGSFEIGVNYALVVSSCAGLWAYVVGDTVRFIERDPPRLLVSGRTSYTLSAFGEHLIGEEIETAVAEAAREIDAGIADYAVGARFPESAGARGGHVYVVEFDRPLSADARRRFATTLDETLSGVNDDYRAHRAQGFGMDAPEVRAVAHGTFAAWMKARGQLGGQHKVPRIINDAALFATLLDFTASEIRR